MYDIAKYLEANSVEEAIKLLQDNPKAKIISGGTDVLIRIHEGKFKDAELISINGIKELKEITKEDDETIVIGAGTTFSHITNNPIIKENIPVLGEAVDMVGGPQTRNVGTIGGNICNGATSADSASTLFALNAKLKIQGPQGIRIVNITEFYEWAGKVYLGRDEVLVAILITPENYKGYAGHYVKYAMRKALDIATLGCSVVCKADGKKIEDFRIAFGVAGPTPMRCPKTEALVKDKEYSEGLLEQIGKTAITEANPRTSWRASKEFRLQLIQELSKRVFKEAFTKAGGEL